MARQHATEGKPHPHNVDRPDELCVGISVFYSYSTFSHPMQRIPCIQQLLQRLKIRALQRSPGGNIHELMTDQKYGIGRKRWIPHGIPGGVASGGMHKT